MKKLVNFLVERKFENIIILDNKSTYPPLLTYYKNLLPNVKVELMEKNYGHMVFFENRDLQKKYGQGFYVVTDADIVPNENLPKDFMKTMLKILLKEFDNINKVGFALDIDNIPDFYILKDKVLRWEKKFWQKKYSNKMDAYRADIDTTFAIYKPRYPQLFKTMTFYEGIRIGGDFTAEHGGWYIDHNQLTDEEEFFKNTASNSSSWKPEKNKELSGRFKDLYL